MINHVRTFRGRPYFARAAIFLAGRPYFAGAGLHRLPYIAGVFEAIAGPVFGVFVDVFHYHVERLLISYYMFVVTGMPHGGCLRMIPTPRSRDSGLECADNKGQSGVVVEIADCIVMARRNQATARPG